MADRSVNFLYFTSPSHHKGMDLMIRLLEVVTVSDIIDGTGGVSVISMQRARCTHAHIHEGHLQMSRSCGSKPPAGVTYWKL